MKTFAVVLALVCAANALSVDQHFELFKLRHAKSYRTGLEHNLRKAIFSDNLKYIEKHNAEAALGVHSYTLAVNQFADKTHKEFLAERTSAQKKYFKPMLSAKHVDTSALAQEVDWREKGFVTPIKDQGQCGSCWTFSATGSMEGQHKNRTGKLVSLSEQNLLDCVHPFTDGCNGGQMDDAFEYVISNGIMGESDYPYKAKDGSCVFDDASVVANMKNYVDVAYGSESALQQAVSEVGPISIGIDASHMSFQFYSDGVYDPDLCSSYQLDHGVLAVGYGAYDSKDYWMVKNSWGTGWGMDGYIMMARNNDNKCGVATDASYPLA